MSSFSLIFLNSFHAHSNDLILLLQSIDMLGPLTSIYSAVEATQYLHWYVVLFNRKTMLLLWNVTL